MGFPGPRIHAQWLPPMDTRPNNPKKLTMPSAARLNTGAPRSFSPPPSFSSPLSKMEARNTYSSRSVCILILCSPPSSPVPHSPSAKNSRAARKGVKDDRFVLPWHLITNRLWASGDFAGLLRRDGLPNHGHQPPAKFPSRALMLWSAGRSIRHERCKPRW